jgi:hypothetical protein
VGDGRVGDGLDVAAGGFVAIMLSIGVYSDSITGGGCRESYSRLNAPQFRKKKEMYYMIDGKRRRGVDAGMRHRKQSVLLSSLHECSRRGEAKWIAE